MRIAWIAAVGLLLIAVGVAWQKTGEPPEAGASRPSARLANADEPGARDAGASSTALARHEGAASESIIPPDYENELMTAPDRWELAQKLFAEATRGDAAAQYFLALTLSECKVFENLYFDAGNRHRTVDEALQHAVNRGGFNLEYAAPIIRACSRLVDAREKPFGEWEDWMKVAAANGHPQALVMRASGIAIKGVHTEDPKVKEASLDEARRLARQALRSKDPAAIAGMGSVISWLQKSEGIEDDHEWGWLLAACQRGLDCSRESARYRFRCAYDSRCQPYESGMVDVIRRDTGENFAELERRATEINEKLDADRFDELGL